MIMILYNTNTFTGHPQILCMAQDTEPRQLKTIHRACGIIEYLQKNGRSRLSDIADELDLTPGTVHTYLTTLAAHNLIGRTDGKYELGLGFVPIGNSVRVTTELLAVGKEHLEQLAHKHDSIAHLSTMSGNDLIILHETIAEDSIGKEFHLRKVDKIDTTVHCTAAGKAILAQFPESTVRTVIEERGLPQYTSNTITDVDHLLDERDRIEEQGFALNDEEMIKGNRAVGTAITRDDGTVEGAISISGPANHWKEQLFHEELPRSVVRTANNIEIDLHSNIVL